jgi:anti-sigma regulatory factor (Ser/Thr protein kinase)
MEAAVRSRGYTSQLHYVIDDSSKVGEVRRAAQNRANFEFDAQTAGRVAIAATELANNLLTHAGGGELLIQTLGDDQSPTLELLALDRGPGMSDIKRCLTDGYSTGSTPGTGLGAVRRLADEFDVYSAPGDGTIVMARFGRGLAPRFGAVCVPMSGEIDCGDAWHLVSNGEHTAVIMVDGLGHGTFAAQAAQAGIDSFTASPWLPPKEVMNRAGVAMARTRGGAAACAQLDKNGAVSYAGLGNISGSLVSRDKSQGLVSHSGTLGIQAQRVQQFEYQRTPGMFLIMHSDGISARGTPRERPQLFAHHPAIIAAALYRDFGRNRDDASVVVIG